MVGLVDTFIIINIWTILIWEIILTIIKDKSNVNTTILFIYYTGSWNRMYDPHSEDAYLYIT